MQIKLRLLFFAGLLMMLAQQSQAKEGMWIPTLLKAVEGDMQSIGLKLSAEDIYSINHSSLKDAVVHFGGGCTAEIISNEGLLLTNHHCGYSQIQIHSSLENDYLSHGFWAMTRAEELSNPGLTATFIVGIEDVTNQVMRGCQGLSDEEARAMMAENTKVLETTAIEGTNFLAVVRPFNFGNAYYLITTKTYLDVRLVGAPPSSIGKFGGDTDNWMWPRHTGDFSMFRIYADTNNEPSEYAADNTPYHPNHFFPISMDGIEEGDFTMVFGFPGHTDTYLTSFAVDYVMNRSNPMRINMRKTSLSIIDRAMLSSDLTRIQYAAKQSSISNAYKKWIGQNKGLKILKALEVKLGQESLLTHAHPENSARLEEFEQLYKELEPYQFARELFIEYFYYGPEFLRFSQRFVDLVDNYEELSSEELEATLSKLRKTTLDYFKNYDVEVDRDIFVSLSGLYASYMPDFLSGPLTSHVLNDQEKLEKLADEIYGEGIFTDEQRTMDFLDSFSSKMAKKVGKDKGYMLMEELYDGYFEKIRDSYGTISFSIDELMQEHVLALQEVFPNRVFWPDANSTLRLTYGKAEGSEPQDGVVYKFYTTSDGILMKYIPGNHDFDLPEKLIKLLRDRDFGPYATDGELRICFTGSNHTTGGNSGSPVLDGYGNLIGLNFDRTWESTMSDIMFDPDRCRNIMVDIKYVLFIIDKYAGAKHLIDEMVLVRPKHIEQPEKDVVPGIND